MRIFDRLPPTHPLLEIEPGTLQFAGQRSPQSHTGWGLAGGFSLEQCRGSLEKVRHGKRLKVGSSHCGVGALPTPPKKKTTNFDIKLPREP